jgi:serine/threonine-protein kinase 11
LVLEYADNGSLQSAIAHRHRLPQSTAMSIIRQIAEPLKSLHDAGYVHQDIKPSNILLTKTGRAILADFGTGHSFLSAAVVVGTPAYQAPEALDDSYGDESERELDPDSGPQKEDVWALGITLYQMLFLELPFAGANLFEIVHEINTKPLRIPEGTDPLLVNLLNGMINVDPAKRFSIEQVLAHPLIRNASALASNLPMVPSPRKRAGGVTAFKAEPCQEGAAFADLALVVKRRSSLQQCGFVSARSSPNATARASPKLRPVFRASAGDAQYREFCDFAHKMADAKTVDFA